MPELPEVENVRRTLAGRLIGRTVAAVDVRRADVVEGEATPAAPEALLVGDAVERIERLGKQLAIVGGSGRVVCVHLGMTGSLVVRAMPQPAEAPPPHTHVVWRFAGGDELHFRDPRRFGGVWTFPSEAALRERRWHALGEDALVITPAALAAALSRKRQGIKATLLDQAVLAGMGNIYVDELLFACGIHPLRPAGSLGPVEVRTLVTRMRRLLNRAIEAGGSTLRDYVDGNGDAGGFQLRHKVYGRGGQPCRGRGCGCELASIAVAGRTTVYCAACQPLTGVDRESILPSP